MSDESGRPRPDPKTFRTRRSEIISGISVATILVIIKFTFDLVNGLYENSPKQDDTIKLLKQYCDTRVEERSRSIEKEVGELRNDIRELRGQILTIYGQR